MRLRIDTKTGMPLVVMPKYCAQKKALDFAVANAEWLLDRMQSTQSSIVLEDNQQLCILGENLTIKHQNKLRGVTEKVENELYIFGEPEMLKKRVIDYIKKNIKAYAQEIIDYYSVKLGVFCSDLKIKDTTSRWGSCNNKGEISICWKLAFAPLPVLDYIIIHEVVHLKHFDHSEKFWKAVEKLFPSYKRAQKWLQANQNMLQYIR